MLSSLSTATTTKLAWLPWIQLEISEKNTLLGSKRDNYLLFLISLHHRNQNRILKSNTKAHTKRRVNDVVHAFCGLGCSLTSMDNLGQISESLGYKQHTIYTFVSLMSIWNYFVRVFAGFVSEIILKKYKIPRPMIMALSLLLSALSNIFIAFPFSCSVYIASVLVGFSYGAQLTLLFIIISELFGLKYYSTLFNCGQLASPLGSYLLSVVVVGKLYDKEALKQLAEKGVTRATVKELTCIGKQCYKLSFLVLAGVNIFGALVTFILVMRTGKYYSGDIYKRFKDEMAAADDSKQVTGK